MDIQDYAKKNDLARKLEKAIEAIRVGRGWAVFAGLEKGPITVKVIHDGGSVRFEAIKKKKKAKKAPVEPEPTPVPDEEEPEPAPEEHFKLDSDKTE